MSTLAVVEEILRETETPMSVRQIVELAGERLPTKSKTPDTVVARDLSMDIKKKGESSIFVRTAPGRYTMREIHARRQAEQAAAEQVAVQTTPVLQSALNADRAPTLPARKPAPAADGQGIVSAT
jgi:hypothetical protein